TGVDNKLSIGRPDGIRARFIDELSRRPAIQGNLEKKSVFTLLGRDCDPLASWWPGRSPPHIQRRCKFIYVGSIGVHQIKLVTVALLSSERDAAAIGGDGRTDEHTSERPVPQLY